MSVKKEIAFLTIGVSFACGFFTGSIVSILKMTGGIESSITNPMTQLPAVKEPISIELMERIEDLKETIREDPKNLTAYLKLGNIYFDQNKYREAIAAYSQYLSIKPDDPDVRTSMGILLKGLGDFDGAVEELRRAAQIHPYHANSRFHLGIVLLFEKKDVKGAIKVWEDFLRVEPRGERANWVRAQTERLRAMTP
jgi:tetratricopeptide (TPR) repeat protein